MFQALALLALPVALASTPASSINKAEWAVLNLTVGGRLHKATPAQLPCFSNYDGAPNAPNAAQCSAIETGYKTAQTLIEYFGAGTTSQWETCQPTSQGCLLNSANPTDPSAFTGKTCYQGNIPDYYIQVKNEFDVIAAYDFSLLTGVPLVIKNTGHDYKGRSMRKDALALWTHGLTGLDYNPKFTPAGCPKSKHYPALSIGAGEPFHSVYDYANSKGITFIGGYHETVGAGGGWVQTAGHSVLSPTYGLGVDRVLEYKVVTPDGIYRTANECQNKDLYWALRGGGGGTFGVVLEQTSVVEPKQIPLQVAFIQYTANGTDSQLGFLELLVKSAYQWALEGWGGHMGPAQIINVTPKLTLAEAQASMANVSAYALAYGGTVVIETLPSWYAFYQKYVLKYESGVGTPVALASRLMPATLFNTTAGQQSLIDYFKLAPGSASIIVDTPFAYKGSYGGGSTSTTPAWYNSIWHLLQIGLPLTYNSTVAQYQAAYAHQHQTTLNFTALAPNSGAYMNEGDLYQSDHEDAFWGKENYAKLLAIKNKYDPLHLLDCWQCVGWKKSTNTDFQCYLQVDGTNPDD